LLNVLGQSIKATILHCHFPRIRDRMIKEYFVDTVGKSASSSIAVAMMITTGQAAVKKEIMRSGYVHKPDNCHHDNGLRHYGAGAAGAIQICDLCGSRWQRQRGATQWISVAPKAAPDARTPLCFSNKNRNSTSKAPVEASASSSRASASSSASPPTVLPTVSSPPRLTRRRRASPVSEEENGEDIEMIPTLGSAPPPPPPAIPIHTPPPESASAAAVPVAVAAAEEDGSESLYTEESWSIPKSSHPSASIGEVDDSEI
jgi:hypothetical protein